MMLLRGIALKIKRRESPFYDWLYRTIKALQTADVPVFGPLARMLYAERRARRALWAWCVENFYYIPLFKSQCQTYGKNLKVIGGMPLIWGDLRLHVGADCVFHGTTTLVGHKVFTAPTLKIGNNTHLGSNLGITVGCDVTIGNDVMISNGVNIFSYEAHSTNPELRHAPPPAATGKPVIIGDNVWIGVRCIIMKGVTIGDNSVIAGGSVVTQKVPPNSLVIGNPARVFPLIF